MLRCLLVWLARWVRGGAVWVVRPKAGAWHFASDISVMWTYGRVSPTIDSRDGKGHTNLVHGARRQKLSVVPEAIRVLRQYSGDLRRLALHKR